MAEPVATETPKMRALRNLSAQFPVANQQVANQQTAGRDLQLQSAVARVPASNVGAAPTTQLGAGMAQQAGQQQVQGVQQGVQQQQQVAQLGAQQINQENQARTAGLQSGLAEQKMDAATRLANLDSKLKQDLYDKQMSFEKDELGRSVMNQRQLADYALLSAKSGEELSNYSQKVEQANKRKLSLLENDAKLVREQLIFEQNKKSQERNNDRVRELGEIEAYMNNTIQDAKSKAAKDAAIWSSLGTMAGIGVGAAFGGAAGAQTGAQVGGAAGGIAGSYA